MKTPHKPYWEDDVNTEHKKFVENCVWESREKKYSAAWCKYYKFNLGHEE